MKHIVTTGIVLHRLNYGEADKIITILTPDHGKIRVMARGVRRERSKLAGGIELFSVSSITFIPGKKDINTLVSTRLITHYSHIVEDIQRTTAGYDILKLLHKATQDQCEADYYHLLVRALASLNDKDISPSLTAAWFDMQLLQLLGHQPNLRKTTQDKPLDPNKAFQFDYESMAFFEQSNGNFTSNHIKLLRLLVTEEPRKLMIIKNIDDIVPSLQALLSHALQQFVHT